MLVPLSEGYFAATASHVAAGDELLTGPAEATELLMIAAEEATEEETTGAALAATLVDEEALVLGAPAEPLLVLLQPALTAITMPMPRSSTDELTRFI